MTEPSTSTRMQLNIISEVALSASGEARPIHILRCGTFTDSSGFTFTFEREHLEAIERAFVAGKRAKPPITECHDFGRAVGRVVKVWRDAAGENLYAQPKWNKNGAQLLVDEVYDGFSCEIAGLGDTPTLIGGSLTNYPAVDGLQAVTLSAPMEETQVQLPPRVSSNPPPIPEGVQGTYMVFNSAPLAAGGQRVDNQTLQEIPRMDENEVVSTPPVETPTLPPLPPINDAAMQSQIGAYVQQMEARYQAQQDAAFQRAQAEFERRIADMEARRQIETYAQHATTATLQRQHALPVEADALTAFLSSLNASQRTQAQTLFSRILDAGLVSFEEIGSQGDGPTEQSAKERFDAAVQAKVAGGMSKYSAMQAVGKEQPDLYASYQSESSRRGAVQRKAGK